MKDRLIEVFKDYLFKNYNIELFNINQKSIENFFFIYDGRFVTEICNSIHEYKVFYKNNLFNKKEIMEFKNDTYIIINEILFKKILCSFMSIILIE
jgi:hypothetical protein